MHHTRPGLTPTACAIIVVARMKKAKPDVMRRQLALLEERYDLPVDLEPTELGRRRDLYRVSIRAVNGRGEALEVAGALGSILEDPGS